jgi:microcystin-dependent protein
MRRLLATGGLISSLSITCVNLAGAQDQYLGEIRLFAANFCPSGWLPAAGQTLNINQYTALFALYGTTYGGNGTTDFALPNLSGRAPYGQSSEQPIGAIYGAPSGSAGGAQSPALSVNWCVAMQGIFPSRASETAPEVIFPSRGSETIAPDDIAIAKPSPIPSSETSKHEPLRTGHCTDNETIVTSGTVGDIWRNQNNGWTMGVAHGTDACFSEFNYLASGTPFPQSCRKGATVTATLSVSVAGMGVGWMSAPKELVSITCSQDGDDVPLSAPATTPDDDKYWDHNGSQDGFGG